jgi:hypothetical protein
MTSPASQDPSLGFLPGDHVCAFYVNGILIGNPHYQAD